MTAPPCELLCELLKQSLLAWQLAGEACLAGGGAILVSAERRRVLVKPAPSDLPFRWLVAVDDRERPAISIVAVLRQVREALDPGYATRRVRIGAFPAEHVPVDLAHPPPSSPSPDLIRGSTRRSIALRKSVCEE